MLYCPPNVTLNEIWVDHGISQCFMETVGISIIGGFLLLMGTIQVIIYKRYATRNLNDRYTRLYNVQICVTYFVPILSIIHFSLQAAVYKDGHIYGYMILSLVMTLVMFPFSAFLMGLERRYLLPSVPPRGHGLVLLLFWTLVFVIENLSFINIKKEGWWWHLRNMEDRVEMGLFVSRYISCLMIFILGLRAPGIVQVYRSLHDDLINDGHPYSTRIRATPLLTTMRYYSESAFGNACHKIRLILLFMWPKKNNCLQLQMMICVFILVVERVINLYVPIYGKLIVDSVSIEPITFKWDLIVTFVALMFLQGSGILCFGFLDHLRSFFWIKIQQNTTKVIQVEFVRYLLTVSYHWKTERMDISDERLLKIMNKGTDSINNLLSSILFCISPIIIDIIVAIVFLTYSFDAWFGLIILVTIFWYIVSTIAITKWCTKFQTQMVNQNLLRRHIFVDTIKNSETVKLYGAEQFEVENYRRSLDLCQTEERKVTVTLNILNTMQNITFCGGLLGGSLLCVRMVALHEGLTVGDYVLFLIYIIQLCMPLNSLKNFHRTFQRNLASMEDLLVLFCEQHIIQDPPNAPALLTRRGIIEFRNVSYSDCSHSVKNLTFTVPPGKTIAMVGSANSGKSFIIPLLLRSMDVDSGSIAVDGQDIRTVTQESLKAAIGVIPLAAAIFNNSIRYNIQYGKVGSTDANLISTADIISAAKNADIHDKILTFPDAYDTHICDVMDELSNEDEDCIEIARTIIKSPIIILLEIYSKQNTPRIQAALARACADRPTLIVADKLSTIIHVDEILVFKDGEIVERGRHDELIILGGLYEEMWQKQSKIDNETNWIHRRNRSIFNPYKSKPSERDSDNESVNSM